MDNNAENTTSEQEENKYSYIVTAILRLVVLYGGIYFICTYVDSEASTSKYSRTDSLGGEGAGVLFVMIVLSAIWTVVWYIAMIILMAREEGKKSSIRMYSNLTVLIVPILPVILFILWFLFLWIVGH